MPFQCPLPASSSFLTTLSQIDSHPHFSTSKLIQSKSALNQWCSVLKTQCFRVEKISAEQRWIRADSLWYSTELFSSEKRRFRENQSWSVLKQCWSALMSFMFSESCQNSSALIISGISTRVCKPTEYKHTRVYHPIDNLLWHSPVRQHFHWQNP